MTRGDDLKVHQLVGTAHHQPICPRDGPANGQSFGGSIEMPHVARFAGKRDDRPAGTHQEPRCKREE